MKEVLKVYEDNIQIDESDENLVIHQYDMNMEMNMDLDDDEYEAMFELIRDMLDQNPRLKEIWERVTA